MADLADHAYAHTRSVLGDGEAAIEAASVAVRRGGRARWAVLGHGRAEALVRAAEATGPDLDGLVPDDLSELAAALAATRPPVERAIVDLDTRHTLDRGGFARALGLAVGPAGTRAAAVYLDWQRALDPVLLAHLGPGDCEGLAGVLEHATDPAVDEQALAVADHDTDASSPAATATIAATSPAPVHLRDLLHVGPAVSDHVADCGRCTDRVRAMVSVRTLLAQRPLEPAPEPVRQAARSSRTRRPVPPPALESQPVAWRWRRPALAAVAAAVAFIAAAAAFAAIRSRGDDDDQQLRALTRVPVAGSALAVEPSAVEGATPPPVRLTNDADRSLEWKAESNVPWLVVSPGEGTLDPGRETILQLAVTPAAPEGEVKGAVRITGTDGSDAVVRLSTTVERPPEVAAIAQGCHAVVTVEDDGEIEDVRLHWREGTSERALPLVASDVGFAGDLPRGGLEWWVSATDARGNVSRTPDANLPPDAC